jgi:vacuolar protein sorting-associated protein 53
MAAQDLELALNDLSTDDEEHSAFDGPDFDPIAFINTHFPTEQSLANMEVVMGRLRLKIRKIDDETAKIVRTQAAVREQGNEELDAAKKHIAELFSKIHDIKDRADASERTVQEICRDIQTLDYAKKHLGEAVDTLKKLRTSVSALELLDAAMDSRDYSKAAQVVHGLRGTLPHFEQFRDIPKVRELLDKSHDMEKLLEKFVIDDFQMVDPLANSRSFVRLQSACLVAEALGPDVLTKIVDMFVREVLVEYKSRFSPKAFEGSLGKVESRYAWLRAQLSLVEEGDLKDLFPPSFETSRNLTQVFCIETRQMLLEVLEQDERAGTLEVNEFLIAMQKTIDFEKEIQFRWGGGGEERQVERGGTASSSLADGLVTNSESAARVKARVMQERSIKEAGEKEKEKEKEKETRASFKFIGIMSACFEAHISVYVEMERSKLNEQLRRLISEENWHSESAGSSTCKELSSAVDLFFSIRSSFRRCLALSKNKALLDLSEVFKDVLHVYAGTLASHFPASTSTAALSDVAEHTIASVIATCEYCSRTIGEVEESIRKVINPVLSVDINFSKETDIFSSHLATGLVCLAASAVERSDSCLSSIPRLNLSVEIDEGTHFVSEESSYLKEMSVLLETTARNVGSWLAPMHFTMFTNKVVVALAARFLSYVYKCKRITLIGSQQLLMDCQIVKEAALKLPSLGGGGEFVRTSASQASMYRKLVEKEFGKVENILKMLSISERDAAARFLSIFPAGSALDLQRVLELKGVKKSDVQAAVEQFHGLKEKSR